MRTLALRLAAVLLLLPLHGCMTWQRQPVPSPHRDEFFMGAVRVTRTDGSVVYLEQVTIGTEEVVGRTLMEPHERVTIPIARVRTVEAREEDKLRSFGAFAVGFAAALGALAVAAILILGTGS
ncbi:MAG TPA: hypothetical protein VF771_01620 [Longimicrobiaceae bacterium]